MSLGAWVEHAGETREGGFSANGPLAGVFLGCMCVCIAPRGNREELEQHAGHGGDGVGLELGSSGQKVL